MKGYQVKNNLRQHEKTSQNHKTKYALISGCFNIDLHSLTKYYLYQVIYQSIAFLYI